MKKLICLILILVSFTTGCTTLHKSPMNSPPILTEESQIADYTGQVVCLQGFVSNTKIPQLLGVDITSDTPDLRGEKATATGILRMEIVKSKEVDPYSANRGAGTFYQLVDEKTGSLVQVREMTDP
jgi:ABC-type Fe3+-hydroxamate transport system substrate-binding protein